MTDNNENNNTVVTPVTETPVTPLTVPIDEAPVQSIESEVEKIIEEEPKKETENTPSPEEPKKKSGALKYILIIGLVLIALTVGAIYLIPKNDDPIINPDPDDESYGAKTEQVSHLTNFELTIPADYKKITEGYNKLYYNSKSNTIAVYKSHEFTTYDMVLNSKEEIKKGINEIGQTSSLEVVEEVVEGKRIIVFKGKVEEANLVVIFVEYDGQTMFEIYALSTWLNHEELVREFIRIYETMKRTSFPEEKEDVDPTKKVELNLKISLKERVLPKKREPIKEKTTFDEDNDLKDKKKKVEEGVDPGKGEITPVEPVLETE